MITAKYNTDGGYITIRTAGHADFVQDGPDIVCASVSALMGCIGIYSANHGGEVAEGDGYMNVTMRDNRITREVADAVMEALREVARQHPENVRVL